MSSILKLLGKLKPTDFPAGATLIAEGKPAGLFVLSAGGLEVLRGEMHVASIEDPGAVVGEMSALLGRPASATPGVLLEIARTLAKRLDAATAHLADNRHRFAGKDDMVFLEDVFALLGSAQGRP